MGPSAHGLLSIQQLPGEDWLLQITEPVFSGWAVETSGGEHWQQCGLSHGECLQPCARKCFQSGVWIRALAVWLPCKHERVNNMS